MPIYEFEETATGRRVELHRPISRRDCAPAGMRRVISVSGRGPFTGQAKDPTSAEMAVPRAFKELEDQHPRERIERDAGFSFKDIKRAWFLIPFLTLALSAGAGDLQRSVTFQDGQRITASQLHSLVDGASVATTFYTGRSYVPTLAGGDSVLLYSAALGGFYRMTGNSLLYNNTNLYVLPSSATPASGDVFTLYDISGGQVASVTASNLAAALANQWAQPPATNYSLDGTLLFAINGSSNTTASLRTLLAQFAYHPPFTNLPAVANLSNETAVLVWDPATGTNRTLALQTLFSNAPTFLEHAFSNAPVVSALTNTDLALILSTSTNANPAFGTNPAVAAVSLGSIRTSMFSRYASSTNSLAAATNDLAVVFGVVTNGPHGLPGTPQVVTCRLICLTNEAGYLEGDEVSASSFASMDGNTFRAPISFGANSSNIFCMITYTPNGLRVVDKTAGASPEAYSTITRARWRVRLNAIYYP